MKFFSKLFKYLSITNLDFLVSLIFLIFLSLILVFSIFTGKLILFIPIIFIIIITIAWIFSRKIIFKNDKILYINKKSKYFSKIFSIIYFLFLIIAVMSIYFRNNLYERPSIFFLLVSLMSCIIILKIIYCTKTKISIFQILVQIIILGILITSSQQLLFPNVTETDPWAHSYITSEMLKNYHIINGTSYSELPIFHLLIGISSITSNLNYKYSAMFSISIIQIISGALLVYLISKNLFNNLTIALFSPLFFVISDGFIWMNNVPIPNTLGGIFVLYIIYVFFKILDNKDKLLFESIAIFFMLILIITHTISSLLLGIILIFSLIISLYYFKFNDNLNLDINNESPQITLSRFPKYLPLFFIITLFSYWIYISNDFEILVNLIRAGFSMERYLLSHPLILLTHQFTSPNYVILYNSLGSILVYSLSFLGIYYSISRRGTYKSFIFSLTAIMLFGIYSIEQFGFYYMSYRFSFFNYMFFSILFSVSLIMIYNLIHHEVNKNILLISITFLVTLLMITNITSTINDGLFSKSDTPDLSMTTSELQSIHTLNKITKEKIGTDYYTHYVMDFLKMNNTDISFELLRGAFLEYPRILLIKNNLNERPIRISGINCKINYKPEENLKNNYFSKIYSSNSYAAFYYP